MFTVHVDLVVTFEPPMPDGDKGICFTRAFQLPFAPFDGVRIYSPRIDDCPVPMGYSLSDVVWDLDRRVFLATTHMSNAGMPMAHIPLEVQRLIDLGWRLGSFEDEYGEGDEVEVEPAPRRRKREPEPDPETLQRLGWKDRDDETNRTFRALIRFLTENYLSESAAYAFDITGRFYEQGDLEAGRGKDPKVDEFLSAQHDFDHMSEERRERWRARVLKYPDIADLVRQDTANPAPARRRRRREPA